MPLYDTSLEFRDPTCQTYQCSVAGSICYRYGVLWAYYPRDDVVVTAGEPGLRSYVREDQGAEGIIGFYFCAHCGCMTHWSPRDGHVKQGQPEWGHMGVNSRMLPESLMEGVKREVNYE